MILTIRATRVAASLVGMGLVISAMPAQAGDLFKKHQSYKVVEGYLLAGSPAVAAPSSVVAYVPVAVQPGQGNAPQSGSGLASASPQSSGPASTPSKAEPSGQMFNTLATLPATPAAAAPVQLNLAALASLPVATAPAAVQTVQFAAAPVQTVQLAMAPVQTVQFAAAPVQLAAAPMQFASVPMVQSTTTIAAVPAAVPAAGLTPVQVLVPKHGLLNCFGR
jgi:hypothetical protein